MRRVTRNALVVIGIVIVGLLALGSLPGHLGSGPSYYLEVAETDDDGPAVDASEITDRRYIHTLSVRLSRTMANQMAIRKPSVISKTGSHTRHSMSIAL